MYRCCSWTVSRGKSITYFSEPDGFAIKNTAPIQYIPSRTLFSSDICIERKGGKEGEWNVLALSRAAILRDIELADSFPLPIERTEGKQKDLHLYIIGYRSFTCPELSFRLAALCN